MPDQKVRIFLIDDHPLVREWLANLVHQQSDFLVCGEADNALDALQNIRLAKPDLAIVDISLPGASGIELIKSLKHLHPEVQIIVLSMHDEKLYAERVLRAGASGYIMKRQTTQNVIKTIRRVLAGGLGVSEEIASMLSARLIHGRAAKNGSSAEMLSDRELEVFRLLGQGMDTRKIATDLRISIKTVQVYCARIKEKLGLSNANELLREAIRRSESDPA